MFIPSSGAGSKRCPARTDPIAAHLNWWPRPDAGAMSAIASTPAMAGEWAVVPHITAASDNLTISSIAK